MTERARTTAVSGRRTAAVLALTLLAAAVAATPEAAADKTVQTTVGSSPEAPALVIKEGVIHLTLDDAIEIALRRNLDLSIQRYTHSQSLLGVDQSKGIFDTLTTLDVGLSQTTTPSRLHPRRRHRGQLTDDRSLTHRRPAAHPLRRHRRLQPGRRPQLHQQHQRSSSTPTSSPRGSSPSPSRCGRASASCRPSARSSRRSWPATPTARSSNRWCRRPSRTWRTPTGRWSRPATSWSSPRRAWPWPRSWTSATGCRSTSAPSLPSSWCRARRRWPPAKRGSSAPRPRWATPATGCSSCSTSSGRSTGTSS